MDNTTSQSPNQAEKLIDILYKDDYRVKSYIAQLLAGAVQSVKKQITSGNGSSFDFKGSVGFANGNYLRKQNESSTTETEADVHDHAIMMLLQNLDLTPMSTLPRDATGTIVYLRGELSLRDFSSFGDILSIVASDPKQFSIPKQEARQIQAAFKGISKVVPLNLEAEIIMADGATVRGILKSEYMLTAYRDLVSMYSTHLPGTWDIIGILDRMKPSYAPPSQGLRSSMDTIAMAVKLIYDNGDIDYALTPFLIYRELS